MSNITLTVLSNNQIEENIGNIARLRIEIFREYPYLYDGDFEYEKKYLNKFLHTPDSMLIVLKDNDHIVGAITGLPLEYEDDTIKEPWLKEGINIERIYYFSEILIYPTYRGKGYGKQIFDLAEKTLWAFNRYETVTLATVQRADDHPKKPVDYRSLQTFWENNGYKINESLLCHIPWKEIDDEYESSKELVFWLKGAEA